MKPGRRKDLSGFRNQERCARLFALESSTGADRYLEQTTTAIVAQAATIRDRLGLDDYDDINSGESSDDQMSVARIEIDQTYMATAIRRLKKRVEERDNTIREQTKKFVAFKEGVRDMSERWEKTFDTLEEKLKTREVEIDSLKRKISRKDDLKTELKAKPKRRGEHLPSPN